MKKVFALALSAAMIMSLAACTKTETDETTEATTEATTEVTTEATTTTEAAEETTEATTEATETEAEDAIMTYDEYVAAEVNDEVTVCAYVQAKQSWWDNKATVYLQDEDGAYFCYEMACSEEDYELLTVGQAIKVTGFKSEWAGEVEIVDATFEVVDGNWVAKATDVTDLLGTDDLATKMNQLVKFTDMTVVSVEYKNEEPGDDIYVTLSKDDAEYSFCLEYYLNGSDEDFYNTVGSLEAGATVDVEGFLYWYEGANTHITSVKPAGEADEEVVEDGVMTYDEYVAAEVDDEVTVCAYVQAKQSWWDNKATVYLQDEDGAYFCYEMACSEEDYELLTVGQAIKVTGFKSEWAGEVEIADATFEVVDGNWVAKATDVTDLLGTDELATKMNQLVKFTDMTVVSVEYKNEEPGDDIYVTLSKDDAEYSFCLEYYLNGSDEDFYNEVGSLEAGATVDVEGFLYWYEGANTHITAVTVK